jgi:tetraacyldisaccharide 4'-kinase
LRRASIVVLRPEDADLRDALRQRGVQAPIWIQHRRLVIESPGPAVAFCGIARPEEFYAALKAAGVDVAAKQSFRDHHRYQDADIDAVLSLCQKAGAGVCITTEKDMVRLSEKHRVKLTARVRLEASAVEQLLALLVRK